MPKTAETTQSKAKEEKKDYISIPWGSCARFFLVMVSIFISYRGLQSIIYIGQKLDASNMGSDLICSVLLPWFLVEFFLITITALCLIAWIKKGFSKIKLPTSRGFINDVIVSLYISFIMGTVLGIIVGTKEGFVATITIIILTSIIGGILGFFMGLIEEF